jgi:1-acyl-sn-glycerol-3-phosphate acyltransferase
VTGAQTLSGASRTAPQRRGFPDDHPWYLLSRAAVRAFLRAVASVRVSGMERCPPSGSGGLLLVCNHLNVMDIPLTAAWCPRAVIYFAKSEVRDWPLVGGIGTIYGQIYARRGEADRHAIRESLSCLAADNVLGIFPEGHRSRGQGLLRAQPGVGLLAARSGVKVWPVAVTGTYRILKAVRPRVTLTGGEPFDPMTVARETYGPSPSHQEVADAIMGRIAALLPEPLRGAYRLHVSPA